MTTAESARFGVHLVFVLGAIAGGTFSISRCAESLPASSFAISNSSMVTALTRGILQARVLQLLRTLRAEAPPVALDSRVTHDLRAIRGELEGFRHVNGRSPLSEDELESWLTQVGWRGLPKDPWARLYNYELGSAGIARTYTLGRDGLRGGADDDADIFDTDVWVAE